MTTTRSTQTTWSPSYGNNAAENYQKYFVPVIGGPFALDLVNHAELRPGESVLDVGCGTGILARLAAERVGPGGSVFALDVNAGMLAVARSLPSATQIKWYETAAESVPLPDGSFDVILCGLSLQFFADRPAALREMHRLLKPGGRVCISTPMPSSFLEIFDRALARHVSEEASAFVHAVFSLSDPREMEVLLTGAGFEAVTTRAVTRTLELPPAREFMWQYIYCTPLMAVLPQASEDQRAGLERDVVSGWRPWATDEGMRYEQSTLISSAGR
jgi:ubiquinone/menaquinone biosynthesis C-methylase UbiE